MIKYILAGFLFGAAHGMTVPVEAEENLTKGYHTYDSLGCMLVRECTRDVHQIKNISDVQKFHPNSDYSLVADEFDRMLSSLTKVGVKVFLGHPRYFPMGHRGVYHTVGNNFFLNTVHMGRPGTLMSVVRHEGWHAAQDCMAGTIENSIIAVILPTESVPRIWQEIVEQTYPAHAVPWEAEATWAGKTEGMTEKALSACANGPMWEVYPPTPLTQKWLVESGYIPK